MFHVVHGLSERHLNVLFGIGPAAWLIVVVIDLVMRAVLGQAATRQPDAATAANRPTVVSRLGSGDQRVALARAMQLRPVTKETVMRFNQIADREIRDHRVEVLYDGALLLAVALIVVAVFVAV
jgi:hypothetical protein